MVYIHNDFVRRLLRFYIIFGVVTCSMGDFTMTIVIINIKRNDKEEVIYHSVPLDVYPKYAKELSSYAFALDYLRTCLIQSASNPTIPELETKFNNFLSNIEKNIKGCYQVFPNNKEISFETT